MSQQTTSQQAVNHEPVQHSGSGRAGPQCAGPHSVVSTTKAAIGILMLNALGWFALRPTSQRSAPAATVQAFNAQGLANELRATS